MHNNIVNRNYYKILESDWLSTALTSALIIAITIFSNLIDALTTLFFTNYCVGLKLDSEIGQLAIIGYLKSDSYISQSY